MCTFAEEKHKISYNMKRLLLLAFIAFTCISVSSARSRLYINNCMQQWGYCRNVAITDKSGDIALGNNVCAYDKIPSELAKSIDNLNDSAYYIHDVQLTEKGRWFIRYGNGLLRWHKIPVLLKNAIYELIARGNVIQSVTFNDNSEWIVVYGNGEVRSSFIKMDDWVKNGKEKYGALRFAQINNEGMILAFERGYMYLGNVSEKLKEELRKADFDVTVIKFTPQGAYFFGDQKGNSKFYM